MIISTIANALVQCSARTQAGWITLALVGAACSSLTVRADMALPRLRCRYRLYAGNQLFVTALRRPNRRMADVAFTKKRAGLPRLANPHAPVGTSQARAGAQDAGISTVSTTWITPFDWLTFEIVTIDLPPLASTIQTLPPSCFTVSCSPSAVLSFMPSLRSEAASLPGTTW